MNRLARFVSFNVVGALGVTVQLGFLWLLTRVAVVHYLIATPVAVAAALVHNFIWHRWWTWRDRCAPVATTFARFALANGAVSLAGNLSVMAVLVGGAHANPVVANAVAITVCGVLNFWLADSMVFQEACGAALTRRAPAGRTRHDACTSRRVSVSALHK
jgi:putative flippase GtrA